MSERIDFKALRAQLDFSAVLEHYSVEVKTKGDQAQAFCPLPTHDGEASTRSFSANLKRGVWQCFGCAAKGNVLDFAVRMEGYNPHDGRQFRQGALSVKQKFIGAGAQASKPERTTKRQAADWHSRKQKSRQRSGEQRDESTGKPVKVNAPLDFALKNLDPEHPYLRERGLKPETIKHFGLGYCSRGYMAGRIVIPLHDPHGNLVGYAGRIIEDEAIDEENPKYLFPQRRERQGVIHDFDASRLLFNAHRIEAPADDLIVVTGFFDVFWLWQQRYRNVVSFMGDTCSDQQAKWIASLTTRQANIQLSTDKNSKRLPCIREALSHLATYRFTRWSVKKSLHENLGSSSEKP